MHNTVTDLHKSPATLRLLGIGLWSAPRGQDFPAHRHPCWEIVYYRAGHIHCPVGTDVYAGQPGTLLITPPGVAHAEVAVTDHANLWVQIAAPADTPWPVLCYDDAEQTLGVLLRSLLRETQEKALGHERMIALLLEQLDLLLRRARIAQESPESEQIVCRAERLIEEQSGGKLRISEVACAVGVAPATLRAAFTARRGYAPRTHLQAVRVRRAVALLRTSNLTLEAVANLCGYDSASHLSRHVRRFTGSTPGALRGKEILRVANLEGPPHKV